MSDDTTNVSAEDLQKQISELKSRLDYERSEAKKAFEKRDELKKQLDAIEQKKLEENAQYKDLSNTLKADKEALETKVADAKAEAEAFKTRLAEIEKAQREKLLSSLKDEKLKKFAENITDLAQLEEFVNLNPSVSVNTSRPGKGFRNYEGKSWDDFSSEELEELYKDNPEVYAKLKRQKFKT